MDERVLVRVTGRVQGVGYRAWARDEAERLGVLGWARNEPDGSVSALLVGPAKDVGRVVAAMRRGPRHAAVAALDTEPAPPGEPPAGFSIRP
jgi:acylphosphatase